MKKILKTGKFVYKTTCNVCDCEFVYDEEEVNEILYGTAVEIVKNV